MVNGAFFFFSVFFPATVPLIDKLYANLNYLRGITLTVESFMF